MSNLTTIKIENNALEALKILKERFQFSSYSEALILINSFFLKHLINPKDNSFENNLYKELHKDTLFLAKRIDETKAIIRNLENNNFVFTKQKIDEIYNIITSNPLLISEVKTKEIPKVKNENATEDLESIKKRIEEYKLEIKSLVNERNTLEVSSGQWEMKYNKLKNFGKNYIVEEKSTFGKTKFIFNCDDKDVINYFDLD